MAPPAAAVLSAHGIQALLDLLHGDGWTVMGPTVIDGVIGTAPIRLVDDLPRGIGDHQDGACYRLRERGDDALFGFVVGPQSWKSLLFPARERLRRTGPDGESTPSVDPTPLALFGVRSCDLGAIAVHDRVLRDRPVADAHYAARRAAVFIVAVTCADPGGTCFCASMDTGPDPREGFDLALTELLDDDGHRFLVRAGSSRGTDVLTRLPTTPVSETDSTAVTAVVDTAIGRMGRHLDTTDIRDLLYANAEHPQWTDVESRCLACSNCTLVCPTCFCTSIEDTSNLADGSSERWRVWDSCFTTDFSHLHGGSVRGTTKSRYRQWATHKLASWWDQFGTSGCVGCGRCITWCPVAIDLTAEVAAIRATAPTAPTSAGD
jgi:ferredoxin